MVFFSYSLAAAAFKINLSTYLQTHQAPED